MNGADVKKQGSGYADFAEEKIWEFLVDDSYYPCEYMEKLANAGRDAEKQKLLTAEFADRMAQWNYWTDVLQEAEELGEDFSREDIRSIAENIMRYNISTWCELTDEEQKQYWCYD